jgi:hypothetical protein
LTNIAAIDLALTKRILDEVGELVLFSYVGSLEQWNEKSGHPRASSGTLTRAASVVGSVLPYRVPSQSFRQFASKPLRHVLTAICSLYGDSGAFVSFYS